jgi:hypothetical protein
VIVEALRAALFRDLQPKPRLVLTIAALVFVLARGAAPRRLALEAGSQLPLTAVTASLLAIALSGSFIKVVLAYVPDSWLAGVPGGADAVRVDVAALTDSSS